MYPFFRFKSTALIGATLAAAIALPAIVEPAVAQSREGATKTMGTRYTIAGRQRMLSEGMASAICLSRLNVEQEENESDLYVMRNVFDWYHLGINGGNSGLELQAEQSRLVRRKWERVDKVWQDLSVKYDRVLEGVYIPESDFNAIIDETALLSDLNNSLVVSFRSEYEDEISADGGLGNALLIDLYERQRMLGKKLSKDICLIAQNYNVEESRASLVETVGIYENSVRAFIEGMPALGVPPAPTEEIRDQLELVSQNWASIRPIAEAVANGGQPDLDDLETLHGTMEKITGEMTQAIEALVRFKETAKN
ncbi:type IV pili methyl-accepting chemotaxis transducer N-terminal domain-containing protein [Algicella marina]|uniref:NarX-like N-terminal domain-containing protein n=1 Tax=Algicella marina TaxID=2683284 RepID=A0A6P1T281_9RHOB|nr:type IV pili methyl-accepting chemotaxis transducer N-terminal domain-containing protein [Algicella marina]QHQ36107.1 hypothetical protein GO499_13460 [Algicella marina]